MSADKPRDDDIRPVAQGSRGKVGLDRKIKNIFISDSADSVGGYLLNDVIIPGIKNMLLQGGHGLIDSIFGGRRNSGWNNWSGGPSYNSYGYTSRTDYSGYSGGRSYSYNGPSQPSYYDQQRRRPNDDCVRVYPTWAQADEVKNLLSEILQRKQVVTIGDWNYLSNMQNRDYTDDNWGWYSVSAAKIYVVYNHYQDGGNGYALELPPPVYVTRQ